MVLASKKTIEIEQLPEEEQPVLQETLGEASEGDLPEDDEPQIKMDLMRDESLGYIGIPLPKNVNASDISVENHYMDSLLVVNIKAASAESFADAKISCGDNRVKSIDVVSEDGIVSLKFDLDGIYEPKTIFENNELYISLYSPREIYDKIVVIDPVAGGSDPGLTADVLDTNEKCEEKTIALKVAKTLKGKAEDSDIKFYYTRLDDVNPSDESRVRLANEIKADMYIIVGTNYSEDSALYGITGEYNEDFFIPGFGSVDLTNAIESEVTTAVKGKALGIFNASKEEYGVKHATVPTTKIRLGYLSNPQEAILLNREDYIDKIADGILKGIEEAYKIKEGK